MSKDDLNMASGTSCSCPFCDGTICPDPNDGRFKCNADNKVNIHLVDCVGLYCPMPVMRAKEEIDQLEEGCLMELVADDRASVEDIPRWAKRAGHLFLSMHQIEDEYHFLIQKGKEGS